jgi:hypothetical protein
MPIDFFPARVGENDHVIAEFIDQPLKGSAIIHIGGVTVPINDLAEMIEDKTEFAPTTKR